MTKFALLAALVALVPANVAFANGVALANTASQSGAPQAAAAAPAVGQMLYSTGGKKLGPVYQLDASGSPQLLLDGQLVTVPASTLAVVDNRIQTSLTKKDLLSGH